MMGPDERLNLNNKFIFYTAGIRFGKFNILTNYTATLVVLTANIQILFLLCYQGN
jgi:hypothetical protein